MGIEGCVREFGKGQVPQLLDRIAGGEVASGDPLKQGLEVLGAHGFLRTSFMLPERKPARSTVA